MSHYLKLVLDALFCSKGGSFRNEITWGYRTGGAGKRYFARKHDIIFFYSKTKNYLFNPQYYKSWQNKRYSYNKKYPEYYDENVKKWYHNAICRDVWDDINPLGTENRQRLGYNTQKPESLLERIIQASSNEGDVILDCFCGCGTTVAVAEKLNRKWIGIDITYNAVSLILKRLEDTFGKDFSETADSKKTEIKNNISIKGIPQDMDAAIELANRKDDRLRKEFEKWSILTYSNNRAIINDKKGGDGGIDGIAYISELDLNNNLIRKEILFSVKSSKNLTPSVIRDLAGTIEREGALAGILITLYPMPNLEKEANRYGKYFHKLSGQEINKIQIVAIEDMLNGARIKLPMASEVLKSAERKYKTKQLTIEE
jgi:site-specific DNA-methyltransferase (adenine-specific)